MFIITLISLLKERNFMLSIAHFLTKVISKLVVISWDFDGVVHCVKMSVFGVFVVLIFSHSDWIWRDTKYLSVLSPNAGKYGPGKPRIRILFTQWCSRVIMDYKHRLPVVETRATWLNFQTQTYSKNKNSQKNFLHFSKEVIP